MAEYKCLADLQGKTLKVGDIVYLKGIRYTVNSTFLKEDGLYNDKIFDVLSISSKEGFASNAYGYACNGGAWPECKPHDYAALTRCVIELYKIIEKETSTTSEKEQWYKITTPDLNGISPEEVKTLILKYGGILNSNFGYNSALGVYIWKKNRCVECLTKTDAEAKHAIEVSPTTKITTIKQEEKHENQFQRKKARIERGTRPEGSTVCGRRSKASVAVGHLSYRKVTGI